MSVGKLIEFFSTFTRLPIYAEDVRDHIVEMGIQDEIMFEPMDAPPGRLLGMFVRYRRTAAPYATPQNKSIVFYNRNVTSADEQNYICCKELMHVFDNQMQAVCNNEELLALIGYLFDEPPGNAASTISGYLDHTAQFTALAVMFPHDVRAAFLAARESGRMNDAQIATEAGVPQRFIATVLSADWDRFREILLRL